MNAPAPSAAGTFGGPWVLIFADLAANMLCFFVLQFAMSEVDLDRFRAATDSFQRGPSLERHEAATPLAQRTAPVVVRRAGESLDYLAALFRAELRDDGALAGASLVAEEGRLVLSLPGSALFEPAGDRLSAAAERPLFLLAGMLRGVPNLLEILGEVAPASSQAGGYPSGWELALARAAAVAERLRATGYDRSLGLGGRPATADRIDVIVYEERGKTR